MRSSAEPQRTGTILRVHRRFADHLAQQLFGNRLLRPGRAPSARCCSRRAPRAACRATRRPRRSSSSGMSLEQIFAALRLGREREQLHPHQVDHAAKRDRARAAGRRRRESESAPGLASSRVANFFERAVEVGPFAVHLVDERDPRHVVLVGLPPDGFALRFDPFAGAEDDDARRRARAGCVRLRP